MSEMTLDQLREVMRETAGEGDDVDLDADILHTPFDELEFDSLALMEIAAIIKQRFGIAIPEEAILELRTPRMMLDHVNANSLAR